MEKLIIEILLFIWLLYVLIKQYKKIKKAFKKESSLIILGGAFGLMLHVTIESFSRILVAIIDLFN